MNRILCFIATLALCSCSVKENRTGCPCELLIRPEAPLKTEGNVLVSVVQDGVVVKQGMLDKEDFEGGKCLLTVPRRPSTVTVFSGIKEMNALNGRKLDITYDNQCDELYTCSGKALPDADTYEYVAGMHKNYVRIHLRILGMPEYGSIAIRGGVRGYDLVDAFPYEGIFNYIPEPVDASWTYNVKIPRQLGDCLKMNVVLRGKIVRTVPLGQLIASLGYSYDEDDLLDISMTIDLDKSYAFMAVDDWGEAFSSQIDFGT